MKKYIRIVSLMLAVLTVATLSSCSGCSEKSLYDRGLEVIELIIEKAESDEYIDMYFHNADDAEKIVAEVAAYDYDEPSAVYSVKVDQEEMIDAVGNGYDLDELPKNIKKSLLRSSPSLFFTTVNNKIGVYTIMASSYLISGKSFVDSGVKEDIIYLYAFEDAYPIAVVFSCADEDDIVGASGYVIFDKDFRPESAEDVVDFFDEYGVDADVKKAKK